MGIYLDTTCNRTDGGTHTHRDNGLKQTVMGMSSKDLRIDPRANGSVKPRELDRQSYLFGIRVGEEHHRRLAVAENESERMRDRT